MAGQPTYKVQGAKTLRRTLKQAGLGVQDLRAAHKEAAELVRSAAAPKTPRRTGRLAGTLKAAGSDTIGKVTAGTPKTVPYANPIHWGWPRRNIKAQPWLLEAARATEPRWLDIYMGAVEAVIDKIEGAPGP